MALKLTAPIMNTVKSSRRLLHSRSGFTLIEILTALVIVAVLAAVVAYPFISGLNYLGKGNARTDAQAVARQTMDTLARTLSQAMEVYVSPEDPTVIAYVNARAGKFPSQPENTIIRYWQVLRSNPNEDITIRSAADGGSIRPTSTKCWYDKYSSRDRENRATSSDIDSRFIARTEFTANPSAVGSELYLTGISDPNALNRAIPTATTSFDKATNTISNTQKFIALTPSSDIFDVPMLRFALIREATSTSPALLQISLTISRRDIKSGQPQDVHLEKVVELKNVLH
jgi:prepilin-type N-terminal cleavage/methylation domain-containing protein